MDLNIESHNVTEIFIKSEDELNVEPIEQITCNDVNIKEQDSDSDSEIIRKTYDFNTIYLAGVISTALLAMLGLTYIFTHNIDE